MIITGVVALASEEREKLANFVYLLVKVDEQVPNTDMHN